MEAVGGPATLTVVGSLKVMGSVMITATPQGIKVQSSPGEQAVQDTVREASSRLEILPEEIWLVIMGHLKGNWRDLINLAESNTWFSSLVHSKYPGIRLAEVLPFLVKWIESRGLMNLKLTCRSVSQTVEDVLEAVHHSSSAFSSGDTFNYLAPPHFQRTSGSGGGFQWSLFHPLKKRSHFLFKPQELGLRVTLQSSELLDKLRVDLEQKKVGRVPGKYLIIGYPCYQSGLEDADIDFLERALIPVAGMTDAITSFEWALDCSMDIRTLVARIVGALPNIRCLSIGYLVSPLMNQHEDFGHPLPAAPSLESLSIRMHSLKREFLAEIASRYGGHLNFLAIFLSFFIDNPQRLRRRPYSIGSYLFQELRELQLRLEWDTLPFLKRMSAPNLQRLTFKLFFIFQGDPVVVALETISRAVRQFRALSTFEIELPFLWTSPVDYSVDMSALRRLRHENVKHFKFIGFHLNAPMLAFATMFPNLSSLEVVIGAGYHRMEVTTDPELGLMSNGRVHESKLWSVLTKLEIIIFHDKRPLQDGCRERGFNQKVVCTKKQVNEHFHQQYPRSNT